MTAIPPEGLRYRVHGARDEQSFLNIAKHTTDMIRLAMKSAGRSIHGKILDFGCGCGRTLTAFGPGSNRFTGCDIDKESIEWCKDNIPFADFYHTEFEPPLFFAKDNEFDFIYAISVFTHLFEEDAKTWLKELMRICKPGGTLLISMMSPHTWPDDREIRETLDATGVYSYQDVYRDENSWLGVMPEYYCTIYYNPLYAIRMLERYGKILAYIPGVAVTFQDIYVLEKP